MLEDDDKVLSVLSREPMTINQIAIKAELPEMDVLISINALVDKGVVDITTNYVENIQTPRYFL
jgi:predicted ArsR family transcriptional regulator